jgi:hypothetical protein
LTVSISVKYQLEGCRDVQPLEKSHQYFLACHAWLNKDEEEFPLENGALFGSFCLFVYLSFSLFLLTFRSLFLFPVCMVCVSVSIFFLLVTLIFLLQLLL